MTYEAGIRAARYHRKPLVAHIHATEMDRTHYQPNEWIYQRERRGFEKADKIIAVSNFTKGILTKHYGINPEKIAVVHNAHNEEWMQSGIMSQYPKRHRPMVLFLGRLALQKGTHQFLDVAEAVHKVRPDIEFVMAGTGDMFDEIIERSCAMGLQDNMIFAGKVNQQEAKQLYSQADVFIMPSLSEPFGLVALEAVAHGTPVILSKQSGAGEVLSHTFKVDFWDTQKMSDCVLTILRDPPLAEQLKAESSRELSNLSWHRQAGTVKSIYENTIYDSISVS